MASKNRKRNSQGIKVPMPIIVLLSLIVTILLSYVLLDTHGRVLGARINVLEQELKELEKNCAIELAKWEVLKSPSSIEQALARNRLVMITPPARAVVRLSIHRMSDEVGDLARLGNPPKALMND